jgi:hypothetical protein
MGRKSTRTDKTPYQLRREKLGLSLEKASELLAISEDRLGKIEGRKATAYPDEVMTIAECYEDPSLCNHYCSNQCPIGKKYVPEVEVEDLSRIVLEMVASLNSISAKKDRLIEIAADGNLEGSERKDFEEIQSSLERLSITVEALQLWTESVKDGTSQPSGK